MKKVIFIYPYLTSYILPIIQGYANSNIFIEVIVGDFPKNKGFNAPNYIEHKNIKWKRVKVLKPFGNKFALYQLGIINYIIKSRPDSIITWANPRYLSYWMLLLVCKVFQIPVYSRGHALVKKRKINLIQKIEYYIIIKLSKKYICYTNACKKSLSFLTKDQRKLVVDNNTLINDYYALPEEKTGQENGIFYLGRIRGNCGVDVLIDAMEKVNNQENKISLHIIGGGELEEYVINKSNHFSWLHYYGKVYDQFKIKMISKKCKVGCVPGFMGLNTVHMMSLSLPIITHSDLPSHGPEIEYITHLKNGYLVDTPNDMELFVKAIKYIWSLPIEEIKNYQKNSYDKYLQLSTPPLHIRHIEIMEMDD